MLTFSGRSKHRQAPQGGLCPAADDSAVSLDCQPRSKVDHAEASNLDHAETPQAPDSEAEVRRSGFNTGLGSDLVKSRRRVTAMGFKPHSRHQSRPRDIRLFAALCRIYSGNSDIASVDGDMKVYLTHLIARENSGTNHRIPAAEGPFISPAVEIPFLRGSALIVTCKQRQYCP